MYKKLVVGLFAMATFSPLPFIASQAQAQSNVATAAPRIDGFDVVAVRKPKPGDELGFTLYGSPGGSAAVQISGATGGAVLNEIETGVYEGSYTIRKRDQITPGSKATANLRVGNQVASAVLDEPLIGGRRHSQAGGKGAPKIARFDVDPPQTLGAGEELILTLSGSHNGKASARIAGVRGKIVLNEVRDGIYEGRYTIKRRDRVEPNSVVTGHLQIGERETNAVLGQSLVAKPGDPSRASRASRYCANCGVVEAINVIEVKGEGSYLGKIAGGLAGAILGNQIGHGTDNKVATIAGAAGGAYVGNEVEKRAKTTKHYEVIARLDNGGTQAITFSEPPPFAVGARIKAENGTFTVTQ